jgi:hypothetical protein
MPTIETLTVALNTDTSKMKAGLRSAGIALGALAAGAGVAFKAFEDSQQVINQTNAVLESTGGVAGITADHVTDLATALMEKTAIDDEAVRSTENLLLGFTKLRNEMGAGNDVFDRTTAAALDMSVRLGTDAKTSALQLGKALSDPVAGMAKLARSVGPFTKAQEKAVTAMQESGDLLGAQKVLLDAVEEKFGGAAESAKTDAKTTSTAFGELTESLGGVVSAGITPLLGALQPVLDFLTRFPGLTAAVIASIVGIYAATKAWAAISQAIVIVQKLIALTNPYLLIAAAVIALVVIVVKNWAKIKAVILAVWRAIKGAAMAVFDWFKRNWPLLLAILTGPIGLAVLFIVKNWDKIKAAAGKVFDWLKGAWHTVADVFKDVWHGVADVLGNIWDGIVAVAKTAINGVITILNGFISGVNLVIRGINIVNPGPDVPNVPPIPTLKTGGIVLKTGLALVHEGERFSGVGNDFGGGSVTVNVYGSVIAERDLADTIQKSLLQVKRRSGNLGLA